MIINSPSLANIPITEFGESLQKLVDGGITCFHVDIMDAHYVPNLCFDFNAIKAIKSKYPECEIDIHLMADNPAWYIDKLAEAKVDYINFHMDATPFSGRILTEIKKHGIKAGVVINPSMPVESIKPIAHLLDTVLFMSVEPGYAGQTFLPKSMDRIKELSDLRKEYGYDFKINLDGGVCYEILEEALENGVDIFVTGIYVVFNQPDGITKACERFEHTVTSIYKKT